MKKGICVSLAVVSLFLFTGCGVFLVGAAAGAFSWVAGELSRDYPASFDQAISASRKAAVALEIKILDTDNTGMACTLSGRTKEDVPVTITIKNLAPKQVSIGVRVGHVGVWDRDKAKAIHNYIGEYL